MIQLVIELFRLLQGVLTTGPGVDHGLGLLVIGVTAVAVVVVVIARVLPALVAADASGAARRLMQTADPWRLLSQSDPDAPGRARPRAPAPAFAAA